MDSSTISRSTDRIEPPRLVARLGDGAVNGIPRDVIDGLGAIPLKYFRLLARRHDTPVRRASFLTQLGRQIFQELRESPGVSPPSLARRDLRWYPDAVVPAIVALTSSAPRRLVVNVPRADVVVEVQADVCADGIEPVAGTPPNRRVASWLDVFARHERAVLAAVAAPTVDNLTTALAEDPLLTSVDAKPPARALCSYAQREDSVSWTLV